MGYAGLRRNVAVQASVGAGLGHRKHAVSSSTSRVREHATSRTCGGRISLQSAWERFAAGEIAAGRRDVRRVQVTARLPSSPLLSSPLLSSPSGRRSFTSITHWSINTHTHTTPIAHAIRGPAGRQPPPPLLSPRASRWRTRPPPPPCPCSPGRTTEISPTFWRPRPFLWADGGGWTSERPRGGGPSRARLAGAIAADPDRPDPPRCVMGSTPQLFYHHLPRGGRLGDGRRGSQCWGGVDAQAQANDKKGKKDLPSYEAFKQ